MTFFSGETLTFYDGATARTVSRAVLSRTDGELTIEASAALSASARSDYYALIRHVESGDTWAYAPTAGASTSNLYYDVSTADVDAILARAEEDAEFDLVIIDSGVDGVDLSNRRYPTGL